MAYHHAPPTEPPRTSSAQNLIRRVLLLALDERFISLLSSRISQATSLEPVAVRPGASPRGEASPSSNAGPRYHQLNASSSALSSPEYVARVIQSANICTVLIDLRGHPNELGLSCGFLAALKSIGFAGHVIYVSVSGELLKSSTESRQLRETYPVHAAVEVQLQNRGAGSPQRGITWTVLGRSTEPSDSPISSPMSSHSATPVEQPSTTWRDASDFRDRTNVSRSPSLSANEAPVNPESELVEGVVQAIRSYRGPRSGRKIMLDSSNGRRRSFMHQTDWKPD